MNLIKIKNHIINLDLIKEIIFTTNPKIICFRFINRGESLNIDENDLGKDFEIVKNKIESYCKENII